MLMRKVDHLTVQSPLHLGPYMTGGMVALAGTELPPSYG